LKLRRIAIRLLLAVAAIAGYGIADHIAYRDLRQQGWLNSWEYLTRKDRRLGFRLREGISSKYSGVPIHVNADGVRALATRGHVASKRAGELLVLSAGDSNTFGVSARYEETYSAALERRLGGASRVVDIGVPGHSLLQTVALLREWTVAIHPDVIIVSDSYNNRAFMGRADSAAVFNRDYFLTRPYEFGPFISYPILAAYRKYVVLPRQSGGPVPRLADDAPVPRVSRDSVERLVRDLVDLGARERAAVVFLVTGEMGCPQMEAAVAAFHARRWQEALGVFDSVRALRPSWFLPAYYAFRCASELGRPADAAAIERTFASAYGALSFRYLDSFASLASDDISIFEEATRRPGVAIVDLREPLQPHFVDICHYDSGGHAIIADRLATAVARFMPR
jgi:hypothetical protein